MAIDDKLTRLKEEAHELSKSIAYYNIRQKQEFGKYQAPVRFFNRVYNIIKDEDIAVRNTILREAQKVLYREYKKSKNDAILMHIIETLNKKLSETRGSDWDDDKKELDSVYKKDEMINWATDMYIRQYSKKEYSLDPFSRIKLEHRMLLGLDSKLF